MKTISPLFPSVPSNGAHNITGQELLQNGAEEDTLLGWANRYMEFEVRGVQSDHTFEAKRRDLV